ncbi:MAG: hypothetical protein WAV90_00415 [Gordonia amarae]
MTETDDPRREAFDRGDFADFVPDGWVQLMRELHAALIAADPDLRYRDVKQKFAELRVYVGSVVPETRELIDAAEVRSRSICEQCGRPGVTHKSRMGWYRALCPSCAATQPEGYTAVPTEDDQ